NALARDFRQLDHLGDAQQQNRSKSAEEDLNDDLGKVQLGMDYEVKTAEGFVRLGDAVDKVQHLQPEIDNEGIEQIFRDGVDAAHVNGRAPYAADQHV